MRVILASGSPRRRELLAQLVPTFEVQTSDVDEDALTTSDPVETAELLALAKARPVALENPEALVIGGDTVVALGDVQLAKPVDENDVRRMLRTLSGRSHRVITGIAFVWPGGERQFSDTSIVTFRELTDQEIEAYVASGEPMDKAGAYAIQGGAAAFVEQLQGSQSNVIGLPLEVLQRELRALGVGEQKDPAKL